MQTVPRFTGVDEQLRALAEASPDAILVADAAGDITYTNRAAGRMFGFEPEDVVGRSLTMLMPPRMREAHAGGLARVAAGGEPRLVGTTVEVPAVRSDGHELPVELSLGASETPHGLRFTAIVRDISDRKRRERHLDAQLAVTRALATAGTAEQTVARVLEDLGRALRCDVGSLWVGEPERLQVRRSWQVDPVATEAFVVASRALAHGEGVPAQVAATGQPCWVEHVGTLHEFVRRDVAAQAGIESGIWLPLRSSRGVVGVLELFCRHPLPVDQELGELLMTVASQVGEHVGRLQAQEALAAARRRFANAFEHAPIGMGLVAADGRWLEVNPAICELTGYAEHELLGRRFQDITHPDDLRADEELVAAMLAGERDRYAMDKRYVRRDGTTIWVSLSVSIVRESPDGPYFISQIRDISAEREAARLRERHADALRRSNVELEQFALVAAHDLRSPLGTISGFAELALRRDDVPERLREHLSFMRDGATHATGILDCLLAYAQQAGGEPAIADADLGAITTSVLGALHADIERRDAEITVDPLPTVQADPAQLAQVLQNLIANAIKFTPEDRRPEVRITAVEDDEELLVSVSDRGTGIDLADIDRVFEMFGRSSRTEQVSGSGIGLAVCAKLVAAHGGRIWATSDGETGTTVTFSLPKG